MNTYFKYFNHPIRKFSSRMLPSSSLTPRPTSSVEESKEEPSVSKKTYMKMPQKGKYRMRAHINPLMEVSIP